MCNVKIDPKKIVVYPHKSIHTLNNMIAPYGMIVKKIPKNVDSYYNYFIQPVGYEPFDVFYFRVVHYAIGGMLVYKGNQFHSSYCNVSMRVPFPKPIRKAFKKCFPEAFFSVDNKEALFLADISLDVKTLINPRPKTTVDKVQSDIAKRVYKRLIKRMKYYKRLSVKKVNKNG